MRYEFARSYRDKTYFAERFAERREIENVDGFVYAYVCICVCVCVYMTIDIISRELHLLRYWNASFELPSEK